ncbi:vitellin-degrading protease-like [Microplitis mediator]|uniref:vitellin-degrading protease-like n=1 Tax=Microplitis mediator TaxID=375433 RepID=UPI002555507E|nr:vitellin-degrading protease-like [Microplitis mediator]
MFKIAALFIFAAAATADPIRNFENFGGKNASITEFPYQVSIQRFGESYCGGVIISEKMILTAATCEAAVGRKIRAGSTFDNVNGSLHSIVEIIRHEQFEIDQFKNQVPVHNIMLLKVNEPFKFDETRQPISLSEPDYQVSEYDVGYLTAWGIIKNEDDTPHSLKKIPVSIISDEICNESYFSYGGIQENQFCASSPETRGEDSCFQYLGSPLTFNGQVFGVSAWKHGCEKSENYQVYTKIAPYLSWIEEKLQL